jgi:hypothetical protein
MFSLSLLDRVDLKFKLGLGEALVRRRFISAKSWVMNGKPSVSGKYLEIFCLNYST